MRRLILLITAAGLAALLLATAPAGYQFAPRGDAEAGWSWLEQSHWRTAGHTAVTVGGIKVRDKDNDQETRYTCTVQVAAVEQGRPSDLELRFAEASQTEDGEATDLELAGGIFRATGLTDERRFVTGDGQRVKRKPRGFLEQQFGDSERGDPLALLLPEPPVAIGETWAMNMDDIVDYLSRDGFVLDEAASRAEATLTGVVERDGVEFGQIAFEVVIVPSEIKDGTFTEARMALTGTAELPLVGDTPYQTVDVVVDIRFLGTVSRKALKVKLDLDMQTTGHVRLAAL